MDLIINNARQALWSEHSFRCALGKNGVVTASVKREGDGATPIGSWAMREVLYRADRLSLPATSLPIRAIAPDDGWCDDPKDAFYNKPVKLPYPASAEKLWLDDNRYDVVVVLGYNDNPVCLGKGSAIFLHVVLQNYFPTRGCVALNIGDLLMVLRDADKSSCVNICDSLEN